MLLILSSVKNMIKVELVKFGFVFFSHISTPLFGQMFLWNILLDWLLLHSIGAGYMWLIPAFTWSQYHSRGSPVGNQLLYRTEAVSFSTQTWTCWEFATCICVFSRSHSPLMADLPVRYFLKSYILIRVCFISLMLLILGSSRCYDGDAWQNIALKIYFQFSQVLYEWLDVFLVAKGIRFCHQLSIGMRLTVRSQKTFLFSHSFSDFTLFFQGRPGNEQNCKTHSLTHRSVHEIFYFATLSLPSLL